MTFSAGTKLGSYEIVGPLGSGGMGAVYRAKDSKLKREVAIKVLPEEFSRDAERVARFLREAEILASLNHPHIAAIYDLAEFGESRCLVLELVEGDTLAQRIARGPIPMDEALAIAKQTAEALEAAHEKGITHRDLKPANIKLKPDGNVKVLDFGLAKVRETRGVDLSNSPTLMTAPSTPGVIMGTAAYMSPEQAKGKEVDRTADVWSFGCVLYEMLTGRAVFEGETVGEILAGVLKAEPDWRPLPAGTPEGIRRLLRRCLQKEYKLRFHDMADVRIEIEAVQSGSEMEASVLQSATRRRERLAWISVLALVTLMAAVAVAWVWWPMPSVPAVPEMRFEIATPPTRDPVSLAISPDGRKIVFVATDQGQSRLWLRSLDSVAARPLVGTDGALYPFWSPDSRSVGFFADGKLKRIDIEGGPAQTLANSASYGGGAWNPDGTIVFNPSAVGSIFRISATGGEPVPLTPVAGPQPQTQRFPQILPGGRHFLFTGAPGDNDVYIGHINGSETKRLLDADAAAVYASSGQLLFVRQGTLFAQDFDPARLELTGNPVRVAEEVAVDLPLGIAAISASAAGPIVYRAGSPLGPRQLIWFDRTGKEIGKVGEPDSASRTRSSLSPDGRRVAMSRTVNGNEDVWLLETARGVLSRFTFDAAIDNFPIWSPDGRRIVFQSNRNGAWGLYVRVATGAGSEELILATPQIKVPTDWSPDGRFLLYRNLDPNTGYDIWALPLDGDRKPLVVVRTNFTERDGQFSPDGHWIAYQSDEAGRFEIYVQPFPGTGAKFQISTNGGAQVRWRRDGKELFYIALDGRLMSVPIQFASNGQAVEAGRPVPLFAARVGGAVPVPGFATQQYVVAPDGQRFLMNTITEEASTSSITVILNWKPKL